MPDHGPLLIIAIALWGASVARFCWPLVRLPLAFTRRTRIRWAQANGYMFDAGPCQLDDVESVQLSRGSEYFLRNIVYGLLETGEDFLVADCGFRHYANEFARYGTLLFIPTPFMIPYVLVERSTPFGEQLESLGLIDQSVEIERFNRRYRVDAHDRKEAVSLLDPRMVELILSLPRSVRIEFNRFGVFLFTKKRLSAKGIGTLIQAGGDAVERIPRVIEANAKRRRVERSYYGVDVTFENPRLTILRLVFAAPFLFTVRYLKPLTPREAWKSFKRGDWATSPTLKRYFWFGIVGSALAVIPVVVFWTYVSGWKTGLVIVGLSLLIPFGTAMRGTRGPVPTGTITSSELFGSSTTSSQVRKPVSGGEILFGVIAIILLLFIMYLFTRVGV